MHMSRSVLHTSGCLGDNRETTSLCACMHDTTRRRCNDDKTTNKDDKNEYTTAANDDACMSQDDTGRRLEDNGLMSRTFHCVQISVHRQTSYPLCLSRQYLCGSFL